MTVLENSTQSEKYFLIVKITVQTNYCTRNEQKTYYKE